MKPKSDPKPNNVVWITEAYHWLMKVPAEDRVRVKAQVEIVAVARIEEDRPFLRWVLMEDVRSWEADQKMGD